MTDKLASMLVEHEGLRLKPYRCTAGKLTIGVGRNLDDRGITPDEALYLLRNDIELSRKELVGAFPWFAKLDDVRQAVLIDMHVNMGLATLSKFVVTLGLIKSGRYDEAASEMLNSAWSRQVGRRARRLAAMMRSGEWS